MTTKDKRSPTFSDTDLMPFGKHEGEPMQDVPARYLQWLWRDGLSDFSRMVIGVVPHVIEHKVKLANYIFNNKDAIAQETGETL